MDPDAYGSELCVLCSYPRRRHSSAASTCEGFKGRPRPRFVKRPDAAPPKGDVEEAIARSKGEGRWSDAVE